MQDRIYRYLETEGVNTQSVGDVLHQINNFQAFKGMSKLSPLKLDISKSPLRRHRANTIQL